MSCRQPSRGFLSHQPYGSPPQMGCPSRMISMPMDPAYFGPATTRHFLADYGFNFIGPDACVMRVLHRSRIGTPFEWENHCRRGSRISGDGERGERLPQTGSSM
jgi:hypothetical protein